MSDLPTVAFIGDESLVVQCAATARAAGWSVAALATRRPEIREQATADGMRAIDASELAHLLRTEPVDILFSIAHEFVLPEEVLELVRLAINFHDGPLPDYAGLAVTTWAILNGEGEHAVTWHTMTSTVDAGQIVLAERFEISPSETAYSLNARCYEEALRTFPRVLERILDHPGPFDAQPDRPGEWFGRYQRPTTLFDVRRSAVEMERSARALDLGTRIRNRVGKLRLVVENDALIVGAATVTATDGREVGTVRSSQDGIRVTTTDGDLLLSDVSTLCGEALTGDEVLGRVGPVLASPPVELVEGLSRLDRDLARHETFWSNRLPGFEPTTPTHLMTTPPLQSSAWRELDVPVPDDVGADELATCVLLWWSRTSDAGTTWFEYSDPGVEGTCGLLHPLAQRPLGRFALDEQSDWIDAHTSVSNELRLLADRGPFLRDLIGRDPALRRRLEPTLGLRLGVPADRHDATTLVEAVIPAEGGRLTLHARESVPHNTVMRCAEQLATLLDSARSEPHRPVTELRLVGPTELAELARWNETLLAYDSTATVDALFRRRAALTPHAPAVTCLGATLTYAELAGRVDAFAARLHQAGARRGSLVGIAIERDIDLLISVLATLSLGAAYVPLDPGYPSERLEYMVADSGLAVLVGDTHVAGRIAGADVEVVPPDSVSEGATAPSPQHQADDLAYVIYTSGSTGRPKGVMLEHRNVVNFFAAMDQTIDHDPPGTWLAVTSLSFDISVLELLWTVTRGFHVVIQKHGITAAQPSQLGSTTSGVGTTSLSLFFFAAGDSQATDGYRLLRESASVADDYGFEAIWLPERHFHEFGGAYPNPSVLASAVAALTRRVHIRAGSVVLPLHASARVAEEWAVVDNLSGGRVGISFAPGWQPNDFVLNPTGFATARDGLQGRIDEVRSLWRGDSVQMTGPDGAMVDVRTLPRPIQPELPVWLTSAGTTATFERAGEMGLNLLTHLLGQSVEQLADNIAVYRAAWKASGHAGAGHVTVMLHTFLHDDHDRALELAMDPMKSYLGSAAGLLKNLASAFPTFANAGASADEAFRSLSDAELDELLTVAATRYLYTSGLFGSVDDATELATTLNQIGVDEIACLIDFGLDTDEVLASLPMLGELSVRLAALGTSSTEPTDATTEGVPSDAMADLVERHHVTHLQCTPSLAAMLLADPKDRRALGSIRHLMVGGEALPENLQRELRAEVAGRFTNMYGPTETTIWSLVHELDEPIDGPIPIGRPIGNTSVHVLDSRGQQLPIGALGELHIGGDGVARGYLGREDLTSQRFVDRPGKGRLYATGDLVRIHDGGVVEFSGRVDFQVKIRGHRIELGEIEAQLDLHPSVARSVVVARGQAGDARLVAFVVLAPDVALDAAELREHVRSVLPDVMVPDLIVSLPTLPLTPNGKVDRAALPSDLAQFSVGVVVGDLEVPEDDFERLVAAAWEEQLGRPVGRAENFFDIGGNSLLAVAVFRQLQGQTGASIGLTDVFRYPTVEGFARFLQRSNGDGSDSAKTTAGVDRGARRRRMLESRRRD